MCVTVPFKELGSYICMCVLCLANTLFSLYHYCEFPFLIPNNIFLHFTNSEKSKIYIVIVIYIQDHLSK